MGKVRHNDLMVFCTSAEANGEVYSSRVRTWYAAVSQNIKDADIYCCVDGKFHGEIPAGLNVIELTPALGRSSNKIFPGWRRSYGKMLSMALSCDYPYVAHIENDCLIKNWDKVDQYIRKPGLYSGMCKNYACIESAFQILNDLDARKRLASKYTTEAGIYENTIFERELEKYKFEFPFDTIRWHDRRGNRLFTGKEDFLCQSC